MAALTNVPELVDTLPTLTSRATLTGKERLEHLRIEDSLVSETFMYDYLMSRKDIDVPMSFLVSTPTTTTATAPLTVSTLVRTVNIKIIDFIDIVVISIRIRMYVVQVP